MRLLTLVQKAVGIAPHQRFRHEQWAPYLERDHDIRLEFEPFESPALTEILYRPGHRPRKAALVLGDALRRWSHRHRAREFDGVVVMREAMLLGGPIVERAIVRDGIPLIFDFDDAIWLSNTRGPNGVLAMVRAPWKTSELCRIATAVTVGNQYLADYARQFNTDVRIVRTSIDLERFTLFPMPDTDQPFTIAWTGSHSTLQHLETVRGAIETIAARRPVCVRVVCDRPPPPFAGATLDFVPWTPATEASALAPAHVGIMPLPDTEAARAKCGCKALQYMAIGRPAIVAPVGINREIIEDGRNGLFATTQDEWVAQLERLANDPALRATLAAAGRTTVEQQYSARRSAADFAAVVRHAVGADTERTSPDVRASSRSQ